MEKIVNYMVKGDSLQFGDVQAPFFNVNYRGALTAATTTAVGGVLKLQNTTGYDLIVEEVILAVTTKSTGAATVDVGIDDGGDVSSDILIDGGDVGTAAKVLSNAIQGGTNGGMAVWPKDQYLVATASATTAGMVGTYVIKAIAK